MKTFVRWLFLLGLLFSIQMRASQPIGGTVMFWGYDIQGSGTLSPLKVLSIGGQALTNAIAVAAGDGHGLALRSDSTVVGFGFNGYGQTIGSCVSHSEIADGVVRIDGKELSNVVAIAAGGNHSLALRNDGTVIGWGSQVVPTGLSNIAGIATGYNYSMGVKTDGTVLFMGGGDLSSWRSYPDHRESDYASIFLGLGNSQKVEGLSNVVAVAIGANSAFGSMVLKADGTVVQISLEKQLASTVLLSNAISISGGWDGLALERDGTVAGWGPAAEMPSGLTNVTAVAGGPRHNLAVKEDGTLTMWGGYRVKELAVPLGLSNVLSVAVGKDFFLAITNSTHVAETNK